MLRQLLLCVALLSPTIAKSLETKEHEDCSTELWHPEGVTREQWIRCNGMPCDQWRRTKEKQMRLKMLASTDNQDDLDSVADIDVMNMNDTVLQENDFDGCIWLAEDQLDGIFEGKGLKTNTNSRKKRKISKTAILNKWTSPIRFKFDGAHTTEERGIIRNAVSHVEAQTCMKFMEIGTHDRFDSNHIIFTKGFTGCHSYVGKVNIIPQAINLEPGCISWYGIIVHEIGHALGLWHEQQRQDRDNHIKVLYENLGGYQGQFYKARNQDTLGVEYDVGSVMHYGPRDGSIDGIKRVMETLNPLYQHNMGQRTGFSFNDAKIINKAYCSASCSQPLSKTCMHGGYQDPNACSQCRCLPGFGGQYCDQVASSNGNCGGVINLNNGHQYITSPGYKSTKYDNNLECNWIIKSPPNTQIRLTFEDKFRVYCEYQGQCFHWVEVKYKNGLEKQGPRFCCYQTPSEQLVSDSNEMAVMFRSNFTVNAYYRDGFKAKIELVGSSPNTPQTTPATIKTTKTTPTTTKATTTTTTTTTSSPMSENEECVMVDIAFLLDSSGSVQRSGWKSTLQYVTNTIQKLELSESCAKIAIISIGNRGYVEIRLNDQYSSKSALLSKISQIRFRDEWTSTGSAFEELVNDVFTKNNGARDVAEKVAVLITDGNSNRGTDVRAAAQKARNSAVKIIGIGIEPGVDKTELEAITNDISCIRYAHFDGIIQTGFINNVVSKIKDLIDMNTVTTGEEYLFHCSFENQNNDQSTMCGIQQSQNDVFDWILKSGKTPSQETGPSGAFNGRYYLYIEASSPRKNGDNAIIELPKVTSTQKYCLSFNYHMHGFHIRQLTVYNQRGALRNTIWQEKGRQGDKWLSASVQIQMISDDKILFEGVRGEAFSGDIAIDNIILTSCE